MNKRYVIYDSSGAIKHAGSCAERDFGKQLDAHEGMFILEGYAEPDEHYISDGVIVEKVLLDTTHSISGLVVVLPSLPAGTEVKVAGQHVVSDEAGVEVEFESPGVYWLLLRPAPQYKRENLEVAVG